MPNNINLILKAIIALSIIGFETNTFALATSTALAASNAVSDASKLSSSSFTQAAPDNNSKDSGAVGVSITYGESKSESKSTTNATTNTASNLSSGGDTIITASSTDKDKGNIEVSGSNVSSNKDVILTASNNSSIYCEGYFCSFC